MDDVLAPLYDAVNSNDWTLRFGPPLMIKSAVSLMYFWTLRTICVRLGVPVFPPPVDKRRERLVDVHRSLFGALLYSFLAGLHMLAVAAVVANPDDPSAPDRQTLAALVIGFYLDESIGRSKEGALALAMETGLLATVMLGCLLPIQVNFDQMGVATHGSAALPVLWIAIAEGLVMFRSVNFSFLVFGGSKPRSALKSVVAWFCFLVDVVGTISVTGMIMATTFVFQEERWWGLGNVSWTGSGGGSLDGVYWRMLTLLWVILGCGGSLFRAYRRISAHVDAFFKPRKGSASKPTGGDKKNK